MRQDISGIKYDRDQPTEGFRKIELKELYNLNRLAGHEFKVAMVRANDYDTMEAAAKDGAVYYMSDRMNRDELIAIIDGVECAVGMFGLENYKDLNKSVVHYYVKEV